MKYSSEDKSEASSFSLTDSFSKLTPIRINIRQSNNPLISVKDTSKALYSSPRPAINSTNRVNKAQEILTKLGNKYNVQSNRAAQSSKNTKDNEASSLLPLEDEKSSSSDSIETKLSVNLEKKTENSFENRRETEDDYESDFESSQLNDSKSTANSFQSILQKQDQTLKHSNQSENSVKTIKSEEIESIHQNIFSLDDLMLNQQIQNKNRRESKEESKPSSEKEDEEIEEILEDDFEEADFEDDDFEEDDFEEEDSCEHLLIDKEKEEAIHKEKSVYNNMPLMKNDIKSFTFQNKSLATSLIESCKAENEIIKNMKSDNNQESSQNKLSSIESNKENLRVKKSKSYNESSQNKLSNMSSIESKKEDTRIKKTKANTERFKNRTPRWTVVEARLKEEPRIEKPRRRTARTFDIRPIQPVQMSWDLEMSSEEETLYDPNKVFSDIPEIVQILEMQKPIENVLNEVFRQQVRLTKQYMASQYRMYLSHCHTVKSLATDQVN